MPALDELRPSFLSLQSGIRRQEDLGLITMVKRNLKPTPFLTKGTSSIPGRTVILKQNTWDVGAHRFTLLETKLAVAATDMPIPRSMW